MDTRRITLTLPEELQHKAERIAAKCRISLSALLTGLLESLTAQAGGYEKAWQRHLAILSQSFGLGTQGQIHWTRDDLHER